MTSFILWYEKLPTFDSYTKKIAEKLNISEKAANTIFSIVIIALLAANLWLPGLIGLIPHVSYWVLLLVYLICAISAAWAMITVATVFSQRVRDWISILGLISVVISFIAISPINYQVNTQYNQGTTYVTYDMTCPYCKKAHTQLIAATNLYNQTHKNQIKIVDIRKDSNLVKKLKSQIKYKGTIINTKTGKQSTYTLKNSKNDPKTPSIGYVWKILNDNAK